MWSGQTFQLFAWLLWGCWVSDDESGLRDEKQRAIELTLEKREERKQGNVKKEKNERKGGSKDKDWMEGRWTRQ